MEVILARGSAKEIADLVVAIQDQQKVEGEIVEEVIRILDQKPADPIFR